MRKITLVVARILLIVVVLLSLLASPVLAMSNPNTIRFYAVGTTPVYKVFYNVSQTGDMLFIAEQFVHYTVSQNYTAGEAFLFEVLNTAGNVTIASTPLKEYEAKPISIYLTAAQVTAASISVGDALILRMMGNPLIFPSPVGNSVNVTLGVSSYFNQTLGVDGGVATNNLLRNFLINDIADDLQTYDSPPAGSEYIVTVASIRYLTVTGGSIFLQGIPSLDTMCPILFQYSSETMLGDSPSSTGAYGSTLTPLSKWGQTAADGLTNLGIYLGINQALAGSVMLLTLVMGLAVYAYTKTQSGIAVLLLISTTPFIGAWLGLMPMALAFIFVIIIVVLLGYFFFSRGAL